MKTNILLIIYLLLNISYSAGQSEGFRRYSFGNYQVKIDTCSDNTSITILQNDKSLYYYCGGDGVRYCGVDTITLNTDKLPDFIYCYQMEEYIVVGLLVSNANASYKNVDVVNIFSPEMYGENFTLNKNEILKDYILKDVNGKGKPSLLTNVIEKDGVYFSIKNFTDTIPYLELKARATGKIKKPRSRGVFLSQPK